MNRPPIIIVGAGIAGLCAAIGLSRAGFPVELYERASELEAVGAGIQLSPNALRVLDRLGVLAEIGALGVPARSVTLRSGRSGRVVARVPVEAADGTGYLAVHRADLQLALLAALRGHTNVQLRLGMVLESAEEQDERVVLSFRRHSDGAIERRETWLAIGADGVKSKLAQSLGLPPPRASGLVAARFSLDFDGADEPTLNGIEAWLGPRRHAVAYPVRGGSQVNIVLISPEAETELEVVAGFGAWDTRLNTMVCGAQFQGLWPLATSEPERRLVHGEWLCLIGDAAHAMLPFAAQGAAMAIEDAWVLSSELARVCDHPRAALARFEAARLPRLEAVRRRVAFHRFVYHLPRPFSFGRDMTLAFRSPEKLRSDLAWLYDWSPRLDGEEKFITDL